jgi:hypothetical protein
VWHRINFFFGYFETAFSINPVALIKLEYGLEKHVKLNSLPQGLKRSKQRAKNGLVGERPA